MLKKLIKKVLSSLGYEIRATESRAASGQSGAAAMSLYRPLYSPWCGDPEFMKFYGKGADRTLVSTVDKPKQSILEYMWGFACWSAPFSRLLHEFVLEHAGVEREVVLGDVFKLALEKKMKVGAVPFDKGLYMDIGTAHELDAALRKFHL